MNHLRAATLVVAVLATAGCTPTGPDQPATKPVAPRPAEPPPKPEAATPPSGGAYRPSAPVHRPQRADAAPGVPKAAPNAAAATQPAKPPAPAPAPANRGPTIEYARDVQPVFAKYCVSCHGPDKQRGGLRLDNTVAARDGGNSGPAVVLGKSGQSLLVHALTGEKGAAVMPPTGDKPTPEEVRSVRLWIDQGAPGPSGETAPTRPPVKSDHWSFQAVVQVEPPAVTAADRVRNPIDRFVLARLEKDGLAPSPEADRVTLVRRLSLDLTGLPPTPKEVDAFVNDRSPDAYEKLVDRLLASPHHGERWGRHWLDLARYADSNGYSIDGPRTIWPYRDWVIRAINQDVPFDRFTVEQLAGDLLPDPTTDQKVATGFHRNTGINQEGGVDAEQFRVEAVVDRVNTTGAVWLGLTVGCCQCHDHKYDPLTQREYYQLFAFFNTQDEPSLTVPGAGKSSASTFVLQESAAKRDTHVLISGDFTRRGVKVTTGTPAVLPKLPATKPTRLDLARWLVDPANPLTPRVTMNRVWGQYFGVGLVETENDFGTQGEKPTHPELLDYLAGEFVARKWSMKAMHRLIVTSATYRQSAAARPELAADDARNRLLGRQARMRLEAEVVRDVCLSASGLLNPAVGGPSVQPPQPDGLGRLTQVSRPWHASTGPDRYRRGMYTLFWRSSPHPALTTFDAPDAGVTCTRRTRSNTPLQALTLLNDAGFYEYAHGLAKRVLAEGGDTDTARLTHAFRLCVARPPTAGELDRLTKLLAKQRAAFTPDSKEPAAVLASGGPAGRLLAARPEPAGEKAAWVAVARTLLNLDETITRE